MSSARLRPLDQTMGGFAAVSDGKGAEDSEAVDKRAGLAYRDTGDPE